jgi:phycocyanobilin lyase beta subunit
MMESSPIGAIEPMVRSLIEGVEKADSATKLVSAVEALAAVCQTEAIPTLVTVLRYNNPGAAVAAVDGLIALGRVTVPYLLDNIDDYNYGARAWATRVFAGIGDPAALDILLDAAKNDFALSVRRSAAKGLGNTHWEWMAKGQVTQAQQQVFEALYQVALDSEWVVRYAAIASLEAFALGNLQYEVNVSEKLMTLKETEKDTMVQTRISWALQNLQAKLTGKLDKFLDGGLPSDK